MCGRYYISDETTEDIKKLARQVEKKLRQNSIAALNRIHSTDIRPSDEAPALLAADGRIACTWLRWGFPWHRGRERGWYSMQAASLPPKSPSFVRASSIGAL